MWWVPLYTPSDWQTLESWKTLTLGADVKKMDTLMHSCRNYVVVVWESHTDLLSEINGPAILLLGIYFRESLIHVQKEICSVIWHAHLSLPGLPSFML